MRVSHKLPRLCEIFLMFQAQADRVNLSMSDTNGIFSMLFRFKLESHIMKVLGYMVNGMLKRLIVVAVRVCSFALITPLKWQENLNCS